MENLQEKIAKFAKLVNDEKRAEISKNYPAININTNRLTGQGSYIVNVVPGKKYTKVDFDGTGYFMVESETGNIYGIKAYGVIHRGHFYGNLDTIDQFYWGKYRPIKK